MRRKIKQQNCKGESLKAEIVPDKITIACTVSQAFTQGHFRNARKEHKNSAF